MTPDGDYYFVVDHFLGVQALRYNGSDFTYFQTVAAADFPWVFAVNDNQTYAAAGCAAKIILYSFDGLTLTKLNEIPEGNNFINLAFSGDLIFGTLVGNKLGIYTIQDNLLIRVETISLASQPYKICTKDGPSGETIIPLFFEAEIVYCKY